MTSGVGLRGVNDTVEFDSVVFHAYANIPAKSNICETANKFESLVTRPKIIHKKILQKCTILLEN